MGILGRILEWVVISYSRGIFPTQGSKPHLLHCRQILYHLSPSGKPIVLNKYLWNGCVCGWSPCLGEASHGLLCADAEDWNLLCSWERLPTLSFEISFPCYQQQSGMRFFPPFPLADWERLPKPFPECFILFFSLNKFTPFFGQGEVCGILAPDQGLNPHPLHWKVKS